MLRCSPTIAQTGEKCVCVCVYIHLLNSVLIALTAGTVIIWYSVVLLTVVVDLTAPCLPFLYTIKYNDDFLGGRRLFAFGFTVLLFYYYCVGFLLGFG